MVFTRCFFFDVHSLSFVLFQFSINDLWFQSVWPVIKDSIFVWHSVESHHHHHHGVYTASKWSVFYWSYDIDLWEYSHEQNTPNSLANNSKQHQIWMKVTISKINFLHLKQYNPINCYAGITNCIESWLLYNFFVSFLFQMENLELWAGARKKWTESN